MNIKQQLSKVLPKYFITYYNKLKYYTKIGKVNKVYKNKLQDIKNKDTIKVIFLLLNVDSWKYDSVYQEFKKNGRFDPIVVICPFINKGNEFLKSELRKSIDYCIKKKYVFKLGYDIEKQVSVDIKSIIKPDIVFFSNPNKLTTQEFLITNYLDTLTCYISYSFRVSNNYEYEFNNNMINFVWKNFCETTIHKEISERCSYNKGLNTVVTGYPQLDEYKYHKYNTNYINYNKNKKLIIWAPHWMIPGFGPANFNWGCFLEYYDFFLKASIEYEHHLDFVIKPHPFLKKTLENDNLWGIERTKEYFQLLKERPNCNIVEGSTVELFKNSDALVHDSGGFIVEYLMVNKPCAYTWQSSRDWNTSFNEFGTMAIDTHEIIYNEKDLLIFIENIINGRDVLKNKRNLFVNKYIDYNSTSAGINIINDINKELSII